MSTSALLEARAITKRFAGITALDAVTVEVGGRELAGLIGPNGAGKTTLFNCILGLERIDAGHVRLNGRDVTRMRVFRRARLGMGRTFQRMELFTGTSVRDHFIVASRAHRQDGSLWRDLCNLARPSERELTESDATLELLGLSDVADAPVESLPLGRGRLVEIGRALMTEPELLLLDEPSSGLDQSETAQLGDTLRTIHSERGTGILLVEHDLDLVRQVAERLYVLDFGVLIAQGSTDSVLHDDAVRKAYLGDTQ